MTRTMLIAAALLTAGSSLTGCATNRDTAGGRAVRGGAIGALGGAVVGAVVPGLSTGEGAAIGAVGGAVVGALDKDKKYYRDSRGQQYWVDRDGYRHYTGN